MLIGEVSRRCGVSTRMLRHYDRVGLVQPTGRTSGGYREYGADDIRRLFHVESLRTLGLSLHDVGSALDDPGFAPAELVGRLIEHTRARIAAEQELLTTLERVDATGPLEWDDVLGVVTLLRGLESPDAARRQQAILSDGAPAPVDALVEAFLTEPDENVAGALRWSIGRADGGVEALVSGLRSDDVAVRRRAVLALATMRTPDVTQALSGALADPDFTVRDRAALAVAERGSVESIPPLVAMVVSGRSDVAAADALGALVDAADHIVDLLRREFDGTDDLPTKLRITQALAEISGTAATRALTDLTHDAEPWIAATARAIVDARD